MSLPGIVQAGHPVLRGRASEVEPERIASDEIQTLIRAMVAVMRDAPGVGLAAPQIGVGLRVVVLEDRPEYMARQRPELLAERERTPLPLQVLINPELVVTGSGSATFFEGCLSVSGYMALVERHREVEVRGLDEHGAPVTSSARGWPARILQHEIDHLNGTLYVDRMITRSFCNNDEVSARWISAPVDEVRAALRI
jgi:peptide deformylase